MELDFSKMVLEVSHHGYLLVTHLTTQEHCCHTPFHAYWYMNVMRSSRLFRVSLFLENGSILMIWGCFSIVSNVIRYNYCCRRHTIHGNMVFSRDSIFPTPQQSGCLLVCSVIELVQDIWMSNACVKFEEHSLNPSKVIALTTKLWHGGGPRRGGGCVADENIIFPKTYISREYNYNV